MEIGALVLIVAIAAALFFGITGFKTRCPNCGAFKLHPKDRERNAEMAQSYKDAISVGFDGSFVANNKPGYVNDWLKCRECGEKYQRHTANEWMNISRKLGDDDAILEYKKLHEEIAAGRQRRAEVQRVK